MKKYMREYMMRYRKENETYKEYTKRKRHEWHVKHRKKALSVLGENCKICGYKGVKSHSMIIHRKGGKPHCTSDLLGIIRNINDYVLLCCPCHKAVHWILKYFGFTWEQVVSYKKEIKNE